VKIRVISGNHQSKIQKTVRFRTLTVRFRTVLILPKIVSVSYTIF